MHVPVRWAACPRAVGITNRTATGALKAPSQSISILNSGEGRGTVIGDIAVIARHIASPEIP